jgi:hypothetical protein
MPTDPRDTGFLVESTDTDGYSDLIQVNGIHFQKFRFPPMESTVTEIWFEESQDNNISNCSPVYYDDGAGTTARLKITVPDDVTVETDSWQAQVDPGKFGGMNFVRIQLTDGTDGVQQTADRSITVGAKDYR